MKFVKHMFVLWVKLGKIIMTNVSKFISYSEELDFFSCVQFPLFPPISLTCSIIPVLVGWSTTGSFAGDKKLTVTHHHDNSLETIYCCDEKASTGCFTDTFPESSVFSMLIFSPHLLDEWTLPITQAKMSPWHITHAKTVNISMRESIGQKYLSVNNMSLIHRTF